MSSAEDIQNSAQSSTSTVVSAIILNGAIFAAEFSLFLLLRPRFKQIYSPKTFRGPAEERTEELPSGLLNWIPTWLRLPTRGILEHQGELNLGPLLFSSLSNLVGSSCLSCFL